MSASRSLRLKCEALFFKPAQLRAEPPDLGVELFNLLLVFRLLRCPALFAGEDDGKAVEDLTAPTMKQIGMDPVFGRQFADTLRLLEQLENDLGFETG